MIRGLASAVSVVSVVCAGCMGVVSALASCSSSSAAPAQTGDSGVPDVGTQPDVNDGGIPDVGTQPDVNDGGGATVIDAPSQSTFATDAGTIHMACQGSGALPVIFLAGGGDPGTIWSGIVSALGPGVLTCTFDRPGVAPSYQPGMLETPQFFADALAQVLSEANIGSRFLVVGHSVAGIVLRVFGASYASRVAGAVFLDPTVPSFIAMDDAGQLAMAGFDPQLTVSEGNAVTTWMSTATVTVLSHDPAWAAGVGFPNQAGWELGQKAYAQLTPNGTQMDVPGASHYVFKDKPAVVVAAIQSILQTAH